MVAAASNATPTSANQRGVATKPYRLPGRVDVVVDTSAR
jgi:hypothetical protein